MTVPGPFTMSQQSQNDHYPNLAEAALDYAAAVNAEIKDLFAAGADRSTNRTCKRGPVLRRTTGFRR
jgi:methionine synthase II (cobalamin-independent)